MFNNYDVKAPVILHGPDQSDMYPGSMRISESCQVFLPKPATTVFLDGHETKCWLDGCVILDDDALLDSGDLADALVKHQSRTDFASFWGHHARSSGAAYIFSPKMETVSVMPDPLGGCTIFHYNYMGTSLISTDLWSLAKIANLLGVVMEKNILFQIERMTLGVGDLSGSPYLHTKMIDQFRYMEIVNNVLMEKKYSSRSIILDDNATYAELIMCARAEILANLNALSAVSSERKIAHITGGFDSRLVTAGLMELGISGEFDFFCSGPEGTADRIVADGISGTLGLTRTLDSGLRANATHSIEDRFLLPMIVSAGMSMTGPTGLEQAVDVMVLGGGYGELLRSFYSRLAPEYSPAWKTEKLTESLYGSHVFSPGRLLRDSASKELGSKVRDRFVSLADEGLPYDFIGDAFYSRSRNRLHIGQNAMQWSRYGHRFDPLYSIAGLALARRLPVVARDSNVIGFDLMESFSGNLASFPFDRERRNSYYRNTRRLSPEIKFSTDRPVFRNVSRPEESKQEPKVPAVPIDADLRKNYVKKANELGVNFWQINDLQATQKSIISLLDSTNWTDFDQYLDHNYVNYIANSDLRRRHEIRDAYSVYSTLLWHAKG